MDEDTEKELDIIEQLAADAKINSADYKAMLDALMLSHNLKHSQQSEAIPAWFSRYHYLTASATSTLLSSVRHQRVVYRERRNYSYETEERDYYGSVYLSIEERLRHA
jgi:hypothetical protein